MHHEPSALVGIRGGLTPEPGRTSSVDPEETARWERARPRQIAEDDAVQERLGEEIADALAELMDPHGVAVHLEAVHLCTQMRGVREEHSKTVTTVWRRGYTHDPELRREFLAEVGRGNPWT